MICDPEYNLYLSDADDEEVESQQEVEQIPDFFKRKPRRRILKLGRRKSNVIVRNAGHIMPFPVDVAFSKFSNFCRHAEWTPKIHSTTYINEAKTKVRWTRETMGFTIGWTTVTTLQERNKSLAWKSIEGIKTENRVIFQAMDNGRGTLMIMSTSYKVPEKVFKPTQKIIGKSKQKRACNSYVESQQIKELLERFCDIVTLEQERDAMYFL